MDSAAERGGDVAARRPYPWRTVWCALLLLRAWAGALHAQPTNDAFANAAVLAGATGSITQSTAGATVELGEPQHGSDPGGASVWFVWEAPQTGMVEFNLHGSEFDTVLGAYAGLSVASLEALAENDDAFDYHPLASRWILLGTQSHLRFPILAGVRYHLAIDGVAGASGELRLSWAVEERPENDDFAQAQTLSGRQGFVITHNAGASKEPGEPNHATNAGSASLWFHWTAPSSGNTRFHTLNSVNDQLAPVNTLLAIYTGTRVDALTPVAANDDNGTSIRSLVQFTAVAGTSYYVAVDAKAGSIYHGRIVLTWVNGVPTNNNFAAATQLSGASGLVQGHNTFATKESNEPAIAENLGGASIWYMWTAPTNGEVEFSTQGSPFLDSLLSVYTGNSLGSLSLVAENDDISGGFLDELIYSRVTWAASAGTTYKIAVDGFRSGSTPATGVVFLQWAFGAVTNDDLAAAQPLAGVRGTIGAGNTFATIEVDEPMHGGNEGGKSIWYRWQALEDGVVVFDLAGSQFDTLLAVYCAEAGAALSGLNRVAENNDSFDGFAPVFDSRVEVAVHSGLNYFIAVDGANDGRGYISDGWLVMNYAFFPVPTLQFTRSAEDLVIEWNGPYTLESCLALGAAWAPVAGPPPVRVSLTNAASQYFRAAHPR